MIVYSRKIIHFVNEIKSTLRDVLSKEIGLKVSNDRFCDRRMENSYPIRVVIYNNNSTLGYFDPSFYELGFNECLMHAGREQLHRIIRHELGHYITFINYGEAVQPHGLEFKTFCQQMGWGEEVSKSSLCLEGVLNESNLGESGIFRKVQKLMALANSSNKNEAEQAMIKSQQLLLKHNIESHYMGGKDDEQIFLKRIMKQKRKDAKIRAIARILETFFVSVVYTRGGDFTYLEILGNAVNIEIADHVANVLQRELDNLWDQAKQSANLKGTIAKNSFFLGIAKGYCNKIQALKREYTRDVTTALMVIEKTLIDAQAMVYSRLTQARSSASYCHESCTLGEKMGKQLTINPAINQSSNTAESLLYIYQT